MLEAIRRHGGRMKSTIIQVLAITAALGLLGLLYMAALVWEDKP